MATGDVTTFGPYNQDNISDIKTDLEAESVVVADTVFSTAVTNGVFYIIRLEA